MTTIEKKYKSGTTFKFGSDYQMVKMTYAVYNITKEYCKRKNIDYYQDWCDAALLNYMNVEISNINEKTLDELSDDIRIHRLSDRTVTEYDLDIKKTVNKATDMLVFLVHCDNIDGLIEYCESNPERLYYIVGYEDNVKELRPFIKYMGNVNGVDFQGKSKKTLKSDKRHAIFTLLKARQLKSNNIKELLEGAFSHVINDKRFLCGMNNPKVEWYPYDFKDIYKPTWQVKKITLSYVSDAFNQIKSGIMNNIKNTILNNEAEHKLFTANLADEDDLKNKIELAAIHCTKKSDGRPNKMIINTRLYESIANTRVYKDMNVFESTSMKLYGYDVILSDEIDSIILYRNNDDFINIYYSTNKCKICDLYLNINVSEKMNNNMIQIPVVNKHKVGAINTDIVNTLNVYNWININVDDIFYNLKETTISKGNHIRKFLDKLYNNVEEETTVANDVIIVNAKSLTSYITDANFIQTPSSTTNGMYVLFGNIGKSEIYLDPMLDNTDFISYTLSRVDIFCNRYIVIDENENDYIFSARIKSDIKMLIK